MSPLKKRTCLRSMRTALNMAAALGVTPYSIRGRNVVFGPWQLAFHIFFTLSIPFLGGYVLIVPNNMLTRNTFGLAVFYFQYVLNSLPVVAFLICNIVYRGDIASANLILLRVERIFIFLDAEPKIHYGILKESVMPVIVACLSADRVCNSPFYFLVHLTANPLENFSSLAMFLTLNFTTHYLHAIEGLILFLLDVTQQYLSLLTRRASSKEHVLIQLCNIHDKLSNVLAIVQKVYGLPLLFLTLTTSFFLNFNIFIITKNVYDKGTIIVSSWIIVMFLLIFRISLASERVKKKGKKFQEVLYRIVKKHRNYRLLYNNYLRAHLLSKKSFSLNLAGFYAVDMKLVSGVISAITTYTVIMIQLGKDF